MSNLLKIILNTARSVAPQVLNFLVALIGLKYLGKESWGDFIHILIWIYFVTFIANFGNKDFLLKKYSQNPSKIYTLFFTSFFSRTLFLILSIVFLFFFSLKIALFSIALSVLIFSYQSLESLVLYFQKFLTQTLAEIIGFSIICIFIFLPDTVTLSTLLLGYCIAFLLKFIIVYVSLKINFQQVKIHFSIRLLKTLIPFFLIGFSGWIASKIDLYMVNILMPKDQLAAYQLLISAFLMLQALAGFITYPFIKHLYRLPKTAIVSIKKRLTLVSIPLVTFGSTLIWAVFEKYIRLDIPLLLYIIGALTSLPIFYYIIDVFMAYKHNNVKQVMYINFFGSIVGLALSALLIPFYKLQGALISAMVTQFLILILYKSQKEKI